jgi:myo-inositol-1(or 4)-monophosphatase
MRNSKLDSSKILEVAIKAAVEAGKILMASYGKLKNSQISSKSRNDFVTELDKKSEKKLISIIRKNFPDHGIQAEESGVSLGKDILWVIDPLDGTSNYIHQFPLFSVSIGILRNNEPLAGVVYDPLHLEMFTAQKNRGAFLNGDKISVSRVVRLADALMTTGIPFKARDRFSEYMESFIAISLASAGMRRGGSAALDLAYVACGRLDGFWEIDLSPWDIAAGVLLIEEAGGRVTDLWGKKDYFKNGDVLTSNGRIHPELFEITSRALNPTQKDKRCLLN